MTQERSSWNVLINRGQENVSVEADPCLQHTFQFLLFFTQSYEDTHGVQIARSAKNEYNKKGNENYLYGGLLATEVLPNICLKENGTISTSDLPQALQYCGVAFSHVEDAEFEEVGSKTTEVKIVFNNPKSPDVPTSKIFKVTDIPSCQITTRSSFPIDKSGNSSTIIAIAAIVLSSTIAVCLTICLLVFFWRRGLMEKEGEELEKQDNKIYGLYYTEDGQLIDQGTVEVEDVNPYYG